MHRYGPLALLSITLDPALFSLLEPLRRWILRRSALARRLDASDDLLAEALRAIVAAQRAAAPLRPRGARLRDTVRPGSAAGRGTAGSDRDGPATARSPPPHFLKT